MSKPRCNSERVCTISTQNSGRSKYILGTVCISRNVLGLKHNFTALMKTYYQLYCKILMELSRLIHISFFRVLCVCPKIKKPHLNFLTDRFINNKIVPPLPLSQYFYPILQCGIRYYIFIHVIVTL